jgi:phosphoadenosine phosphosulfate reductase
LSVVPIPPKLNVASPDDPAAWLVAVADAFPGRVALVSALGMQSLLALDLLAEAGRSVPLLFLDTGHHFDATLELLDRVQARWGCPVVRLTPEGPGPGPSDDPTACCAHRKVAPLSRALREYDTWISGIRADQTAERAHAPRFGWDEAHGLWKLNPFLRWSREQVRAEIARRDLPSHPLWSQGYASVGCAPCTQPSADGAERSGRFVGQGRRECGIHLPRRAAVTPFASPLTLSVPSPRPRGEKESA